VPARPDRLRGPPSLLFYMDTGSYFPGGKAAETWSWLLIFIQCWLLKRASKKWQCATMQPYWTFCVGALCLVSMIMRWKRPVARMVEKRNAYKTLVYNPERKIPLGRPTRMWEDNIEMDLRKIGWENFDWIHLAQERDQWRAVVNIVMNLRVK
jgi:hypothetical protein